MPQLSVLVSAENEVLGTFTADTPAGDGAPARVGLQAGPGQRVISVSVDDATARLSPEALHDRIKADHLQ